MSEHGHCKEYLHQLSIYVDGELSPELCAQLEKHLKECENCRIVFNTLKKTIDLYHVHAGDEVLPERVRSRLFKRLQLDAVDGDNPRE